MRTSLTSEPTNSVDAAMPGSGFLPDEPPRALAFLKAEIASGNALEREKEHSASLFDRLCIIRRENLELRDVNRRQEADLIRAAATIARLDRELAALRRARSDDGDSE